MAFDWLFWLGILDLIATAWLLIRFRLKLLSTEPDIDDIEQDLDDLYISVQELEKKLNIATANMYDMVEGTLRPLNRKIGLREKRDQEKELKIDEPYKKGGIIGYPPK